jgi:magnesium transporter
MTSTVPEKAIDRADLRAMHPADIAELFDREPLDLHPVILSLLDDDQRAELLVYLDATERREVLDQRSPTEIAGLLSELESDDAADVLGDLEEHTAVRVLEQLDPEDAEDVRLLLDYAEDSAGGLMQREIASIPITATAGAALEALRRWEDDADNMHFVFVVDSQHRFLGVVHITRLALAPLSRPIADLMEKKFIEVHASVDQEEVAQIFAKYDIISLAVCDEDSRLIGRIMVDDIVDVLEEEADEDAFRMVGSDSEELLYRNRSFKIALIRSPWLLVNLLGGTCTGYLLWVFQATLVDQIALVAFVPVITAMGGNVGAQSAMIVIRGFATGRIGTQDLGPTVRREAVIGVMMGSVCGGLLGLGAILWHGDPRIGLVVALAMFIAMTVAAAVGGLAPILFRRVGIDPAIAAGPFVTTANDIVGIVIYMVTATLLLGT